jgi:hypothetical protein
MGPARLTGRGVPTGAAAGRTNGGQWRGGEEIGLLTDRLTPGLLGYLVLIVSGIFLPIIAVVGYLAVALYYIIPFRRLSAGVFPLRLHKKRVKPQDASRRP